MIMAQDTYESQVGPTVLLPHLLSRAIPPRLNIATSDSDAYRVDGDDVVVCRHGATTTHERRQQHQIRRPAVPYMCHKQGQTGVSIGFQRRTTSRVLTCGFTVFTLGNSGGQIDLGNHCSIP